MLGLVTGSDFTKMSLYNLDRSPSGSPSITRVTTPGSERMTTRDVPMPLIKNLMDLHESAAPGSVKGFANTVFKTGLMDELLADAVESRSGLASPSKRVDTRNPESVMHAFYAASFLQNEEASECLVYSHQGRVVGMAQIGNFARHVDGMGCTISNLVVSPKLDSTAQGALIRHIAGTAKEQMGEASLLTPEPWGAAYSSYGFSIEPAGPKIKDPVGDAIVRGSGLTPVCQVGKSNVVRCRWQS